MAVFLFLASALVPVLVALRNGLVDSASGLATISKIFTAVNHTVATDILPVSENAITMGDTLMNMLGGPPYVQGVLDDVGLIFQQMELAISSFSSSAAATAMLYHPWPVGKHGFTIHALSEAVWVSASVINAVLATFALLSLFGLRASSCGARTFRWCHCLLLDLMLLLWFACAVLLPVVLVGADVCVAPGVAVLAVINATDSGGVAEPGQFGPAYEAARFYTSPCGSEPPAGAYSVLLDAQATAGTALTDFAVLNASVAALNASVRTAIWPIVDALGDDVDTLAVAINETIGRVDCPPVYDAFIIVSGYTLQFRTGFS